MFTNTPSLEEVPAPIWIALGLLAFLVWWPLGLLVLALAMWRGCMLCCGFGFGHWNDRVDRSPVPREGAAPSPTSGNRAFDAYRAETLKRLEEEQRSFREYQSIALLHRNGRTSARAASGSITVERLLRT